MSCEARLHFGNAGGEARIVALRREASEAGVSDSEFEEALGRANALDGDPDVFSDTELDELELALDGPSRPSAGRPPAAGLAPPSPRETLAQTVAKNVEDRRRSAALARAVGGGLSPETIRAAQPAGRLLTPPPPSTTHRLLANDCVTRTKYWGRVAPDGSMFAIGTNRGMSVFDLRPGRTNAVHIRHGAADPAFTNDALIFQGGGTWRASLDWLRNDPPEEIHGEVPGFVSRIGSLALYQDVASDGGRGIAIDGSTWSADSGPASRDPRVVGSANGTLRIHHLDGLMGAAQNTQTIATPFHVGFQLANDGEHVVAQIVNPDAPGRQVGYAIYRIARRESGEVTLTAVRVVAGLSGGKAKMARDFIAFQHAATSADFATYGFTSADAPEFQEILRRGTSDIYVYDLRDNTARRVTSAGPGNLAWSPSFSSDAAGALRVHYLQLDADGSRRIMSVPIEP